MPRKAQQVDVILNEHDVTHILAAIESPCCIYHNQSFHAQQVEDSHRASERDRGRGRATEASPDRERRSYSYEVYKETADWLKAHTEQPPEVAIIRGSGLGGLADLLDDTTVFPYKDIPRFPTSTGINTIPEVVVSRHCGLRVLGLSLITDKVVTEYDSDEKANHEEVLRTTQHRTQDLQRLVRRLITKI
ncbi:hypothetical protein PAMP_012795 [Pampus punctatissimus]